MNIVTDFSKYKFHCSSVGKLMVGVQIGLTEPQKKLLTYLEIKKESKGLTDKQYITYGELLAKKHAKPKLSKSAESYLQDLHKEVMFNRNKDISTKYMDKGVQVEEQSITLYSEVNNCLFIKNKKTFENEYLIGTPDNIQKKVRDIKSSWDFTTFPMYESEIPNKDYEWQLQGYMALTFLKESELAYCLVDTPEMIIEDEKRRTSWKLGMIELPEELEKEIEDNMVFKDIPKELRVKSFDLDYNPEAIKALYSQIELAREYMTNLSIQVVEQFKLVA